MEWLDRVVHTFIMTFGITQPGPAQRRTANLIIGGLLLLVLLGISAIVVVASRAMAH